MAHHARGRAFPRSEDRGGRAETDRRGRGMTSTMDGQDWLAQAATGGLPEPVRQRWQPLRVGIVNLWEYDTAEFWFADGRLVLRGGNGAGKTKVLELTTLMLLRGEVTPSVLDPFGSQHRTMRFNLLPTGDADDPRPPSDSGLGYAWVEFGRRDETGGQEFYVCGLGASARRGSGTSPVSTWQFTTRLRPGKDLLLTRAGRPMEQKELKKIPGVTVAESAAAYRARIAADLFDLDTASYDNLTELLKQLRKPKLGERLNPATLAETLREALPPLATNEVEQLADGWDRLERLRMAVEATKEAAKQVAAFDRTAWRPWAKIVVRRRADAFATARSRLERTTKDKNAAVEQLGSAKDDVARLEAELKRSSTERNDVETALRELLESTAYQDAARLTDRVGMLQRELNSLGERLTEAGRTEASERDELERRQAKFEAASAAATRAAEAIDQHIGSVEAAAKPAGLGASAERFLPARDVPSLRADLQRRMERFGRMRSLHDNHQRALHSTELTARKVSVCEEGAERARLDERTAHEDVEEAVDSLRQRIREWATTTVVEVSDELSEQWCDLVADLTTSVASPEQAIRDHVAAAKAALEASRVEALRARDPLVALHEKTTAELEKVKARKELPPPEPTLWQRTERPGDDADSGAPLWRCVQPRDELPSAQLDRIEAALAASGLLDAWLSPEGTLRTQDGTVVADTTLVAGPPASGNTLATVLEPTPTGGISGDVVATLLAGIDWRRRGSAASSGNWLADDGSWSIGVLAGRAEPSRPASFLGATARAEARRREIAALEAELAALAERIEQLSARIASLDEQIDATAREARTVPRDAPVTTAVTTWTERQRAHEAAVLRLAEAQREHQREESKRDVAWTELSTFAGEYGFPLRGLDELREALDRYADVLRELAARVDTARRCRDEAEVAAEEVERQAAKVTAAQGRAEVLRTQVRAAEVQVRTAREALDEGPAELLARKERLDTTSNELADTVEKLTDSVREAEKAAVKAESILESHEQRRAEAEAVRDAALGAWWEVYEAGLAPAIGLPEPDRRNVETGRNAVVDARKAVAAVDDEHAEERAARKCTQRLLELKQQLLPNRDARIDEDATIPRFLVMAHGDTGWQLPGPAADSLAEQVRRQEDRFDSEQREVLATLLGSTFIEHLKDRLDYTERTFAGINDRLRSHATRHGHAVRLTHEPDPADPDARDVVTALNQGYAQLSQARQDLVRDFLARRIDEARAEAAADQATDWKEQLSIALDYRRWLRISLEYRPGMQAQWRPFDRAQHGAKSGGEKVVLLSQPLFAATVVAFDAAGPQAPRWVWLDEAMTGVDAQYKASFMGLTVGFDLDIMLTAHDEWCTYPTVPAVAVYDLARSPHLPGVDAQPHLWCGGELTDIAMAEPAPSFGLDADDGLFGISGARP
ncbi:TIGR02680 family protein [Prauserella flavalba]